MDFFERRQIPYIVIGNVADMPATPDYKHWAYLALDANPSPILYAVNNNREWTQINQPEIEHDETIAYNRTIPAGRRAIYAGPVTITESITVEGVLTIV